MYIKNNISTVFVEFVCPTSWFRQSIFYYNELNIFMLAETIFHGSVIFLPSMFPPV